MLDNQKLTIKRLHEDGVITLENENGYYVNYERTALLQAYSDGRLKADRVGMTSTTSIQRFGRPFEELSEKVQRQSLRRKCYVEAMCAQGAVKWTQHSAGEVIKTIAEEIGDVIAPSIISVYRWHRIYLQTGEHRDLIPRYDRRGPRQPLINQSVIELFLEALTHTARVSKGWTMRDVRDELGRLILETNRRCLPSEELKLPSLRSLYRLWQRVGEYDVALIKGEMSKRRFKVTRFGVKTTRILERVEIDHTPLDLFLVKDSTYEVLGRPTLTILIDHYSRMPLGYYLSFGGTSTNAVLRAIRHAILPKRKSEVIPRLPIQHEWPCYGVMEELVADNGMEFHSSALEQACFDLGVRILYCPVKKPQFKGVVERFLKTINHGLVHKLPGTSLSNIIERGDYDPQKHAILTLAEFTHVLEKWFLDIYAQTKHSGIGETPYARWCASEKADPPHLPGCLEEITKGVGISTTRRLRHDGIRLNDLYYASPALEVILKAYGEGVDVRVAYDPDDLGSITLWPPDCHEPVRVPAARCEYASGLTLVQHQLNKDIAKRQGLEGSDIDVLMQAKMDLADTIRRAFANRRLRSRKKAAKASGISSASPQGHTVQDGSTAPADVVRRKTGDKISKNDKPLAYPIIHRK